LAFVADFGTQNFHLKTNFDMKNKTLINHENGNDANRLLATVPILTKGDRPDFIAKHKHLFEKLTDEEATNILIAIWNFGNERWNAGYNQGYRNPDFD
jgi:hypothetical protein